jgi:hypothetical protein
VSLDSATIAFNTARAQGGGVFAAAGATLNTTNSIIARNTAVAGGTDLFGAVASFLSGGFNLIGNNVDLFFTALGSDMTNKNPLLGTLVNNGGPTVTHALLTGSPAINTGSTVQTVDQRNNPRPAVNKDIGAFEL